MNEKDVNVNYAKSCSMHRHVYVDYDLNFLM